MKDIVNQFWKEYEKLDELDRRKKIKVIMNGIKESCDMPKKVQEHVISGLLVSYFDDILNYKDSKWQSERSRMIKLLNKFGVTSW